MTNQSPEGMADGREARMVTLRRDETGKPTVWCDPEIADLVEALNTESIGTIASCSGHGHRPGFIALRDGRWLMVFDNQDHMRAAESAYPFDINGVRRDHTGAGDAIGEPQFSIQERDDDMLIAERHWQFGWRCIARRPKMMTNDEWRPTVKRIIAALSRTPDPLSELQRLGQEYDRDEAHSWLHRHDPPVREPFDRKAVLEEAAKVIAERAWHGSPGYKWANINEDEREEYRKDARAAFAVFAEDEQDLCAEIAQKSGEGE